MSREQHRTTDGLFQNIYINIWRIYSRHRWPPPLTFAASGGEGDVVQCEPVLAGGAFERDPEALRHLEAGLCVEPGEAERARPGGPQRPGLGGLAELGLLAGAGRDPSISTSAGPAWREAGAPVRTTRTRHRRRCPAAAPSAAKPDAVAGAAPAA